VRLDRELAEARAKAAAIEESARGRIEQAVVALADELAAEHGRIAGEIERETATRLGAIETAAREEVERFAAIRDDVAVALAGRVSEQLVALVRAEVAP